MTRPPLLADENIPAPMVDALRAEGWNVAYVSEDSAGISDEDVLARARNESRIILTEDKDFGELVYRMKRGVPGIIMIRLPQGAWHTRWTRIRWTLESRADRLVGHYTVVAEQTIRARRMPTE